MTVNMEKCTTNRGKEKVAGYVYNQPKKLGVQPTL